MNKKTSKRSGVKKSPTPTIVQTPTPTPTTTPFQAEEIKDEMTEKEKWIWWVKNNRKIFMNAGHKSKGEMENIYLAYNIIFDKNSTPSKCGGCNNSVINALKKLL